jgi:hypothetical protein
MREGEEEQTYLQHLRGEILPEGLSIQQKRHLYLGWVAEEVGLLSPSLGSKLEKMRF